MLATVFILLRLLCLWLLRGFVVAHRLSLVAVSGGRSLLHCTGFSLQHLLSWSTGSRHMCFSSCSTWAQKLLLDLWFSSYRTQAQLFHGKWTLPGLGIEPMSPALIGRFFTTEPPGKPKSWLTKLINLQPDSSIKKQRRPKLIKSEMKNETLEPTPQKQKGSYY